MRHRLTRHRRALDPLRAKAPCIVFLDEHCQTLYKDQEAGGLSLEPSPDLSLAIRDAKPMAIELFFFLLLPFRCLPSQLPFFNKLSRVLPPDSRTVSAEGQDKICA